MTTRLTLSTLFLLSSSLAHESVAQPYLADLEKGVRDGQAVIAEAEKAAALTSIQEYQGIIIAQGDSWFDYPGTDVLGALRKKYNYSVRSVATAGDTVEHMAFDKEEVELFRVLFEDAGREMVQKGPIAAILLSGGGNDIAGPELSQLLNHKALGEPAVHDQVARLVLARTARGMATLIGEATAFSEKYLGRKVPIILHGYAPPVPDGRAYRFLGRRWAGPWLKPSFEAKGWTTPEGQQTLDENRRVMQTLMEIYSAELRKIVEAPGWEHVHFLDISSALDFEKRKQSYSKVWDNELHPSGEGFVDVAERFDEAIKAAKQTAPAAKQ